LKVDLVVVNGKLVLPEVGPTAGSLVVNNGKIVKIALPGEEPLADEILDAEGRVVLPGLVDPHVHYGWLLPLEDRIRAESAFGVSGGVTTFMRYFRRPESYLKLLDEQIEMANRLHYQDYAIHLTLFTDNQVAELGQYVERLGVTSFKIYMNMRGEFGRDVVLDLRPGSERVETYNVDFSIAYLYEVFRAAAQIPTRIRISVHCEDGEIVCREIERVRRLGLGGLPAWHYACPDLSEALAISQVSVLSRANNIPVYFPHIGSRAAIKAINEARVGGTDFVAETGPHYLTQTIESPAGILAKIKPPIRTKDDQIAVWQAIQSGLIETIGSDHVGYMIKEKNCENIWKAHTAFAGTGLILPLLLSEGVNRNLISLQQLTRITSYNAARAFGLYPRKGTLLPGADADFVIVDLDQTWRIQASDLLTASDFSIYEGMELTGTVKTVYVRGVKMFENGQLLGKAGHGRYIRRANQGI
jgi:dihydropyrimidinase